MAHLQIPPSAKPGWALDHVFEYCRRDDDQFLDVIDFVLRRFPIGAPRLRALDELLNDGRSCWKIGRADTLQLERRISEQAESMYLSALTSTTGASTHLQAAWSAAYGRPIDAKRAWHEAVAAVEAALQPIVLPKATRASLGSLQNALREAPVKWVCSLPLGSKEEIDSMEAFSTVLDRVMYEPGRHGTDGGTATIEEARSVLMVAVTIVEWVRTGVLAPADNA
jgi:hypothetical protein